MTETTEQFLNLLFNEGETICVSPNKYGYDSVKQSDLNTGMELTGVGSKGPYSAFAAEKDIALVAINPISGKRNDQCVTAFRSFLIELDEGPLAEQSRYIKESGVPYSICVFSGNKSLHYGIILDKPLLNIDIWRYVNQWILNILSKSDQQCKNPSRSIRFPGHVRDGGKEQKLLEIKTRISQETLNIWLNKHPEAMPQPEVRVKKYDPSAVPDIHNMPEWFYEKLEELNNGESDSRNADWFKVSMTMVDRNFELDEILSYLDGFYNEESDFRRREWETCIRSAYKRGMTNV